MRESESTLRRRSKTSDERLCKFGTIVQALWHDKPALNLAQRMGINPATGKPFTERNALQLMRGERRVTARAMLVINTEVLD